MDWVGFEPTKPNGKRFTVARNWPTIRPVQKHKRNRENFYWVLHFSYLHKDTLTLFRLTIIDSLPFNSLQVPELDFLISSYRQNLLSISYRRLLLLVAVIQRIELWPPDRQSGGLPLSNTTKTMDIRNLLLGKELSACLLRTWTFHRQTATRWQHHAVILFRFTS